MSTVPKRGDKTGRARNRFRYGWRDVYRRGPNGKKVWVQIPLTLEDVLHPREGDVIPVNSLHDDLRTYLKTVLESRLADRPDVLVLSDCNIYWDNKELKHHSPDVAVIPGVAHRDPRPSFVVAKENTRPAFILEITSPDTRVNDVKKKVKQYYQAGVPRYLIIDPRKRMGKWVLTLTGYQQGDNKYDEWPPGADGRYPVKPGGVLIGVEDGRVWCYDASTGEKIPDYTGLDRARKEAEERVRQLEEEVRRLRGDQSA